MKYFTLILLFVGSTALACDDKCQDAALDTEVQMVKAAHPNVDFDAPDAEGKTLEYHVLEYAWDNGIPSYAAAYELLSRK